MKKEEAIMCSCCTNKQRILIQPKAIQPPDPRQPTVKELQLAAKYLAMPKPSVPPIGFDPDDDSVYLFKV